MDEQEANESAPQVEVSSDHTEGVKQDTALPGSKIIDSPQESNICGVLDNSQMLPVVQELEAVEPAQAQE